MKPILLIILLLTNFTLLAGELTKSELAAIGIQWWEINIPKETGSYSLVIKTIYRNKKPIINMFIVSAGKKIKIVCFAIGEDKLSISVLEKDYIMGTFHIDSPFVSATSGSGLVSTKGTGEFIQSGKIIKKGPIITNMTILRVNNDKINKSVSIKGTGELIQSGEIIRKESINKQIKILKVNDTINKGESGIKVIIQKNKVYSGTVNKTKKIKIRKIRHPIPG